MSRTKKIIRNIVVLAILFLVFLQLSGLHLTPLAAHENSERTLHYGPSQVVHIEDFDKGKYILGKYDRWVSCNTVKRELFFFWGYGNNPIGFENIPNEAIAYTIDGSHDKDHYDYKLYGIVNDPKVKKVEVILGDGTVLTQNEFYENLFLFTWETEDYDMNWAETEVRGYDEDNELIFTKQWM